MSSAEDRVRSRELLSNSSVGAALGSMRKSPWWCESPVGNEHRVSGDAERAGVSASRCMSCRKHVVADRDPRTGKLWRTEDR